MNTDWDLFTPQNIPRRQTLTLRDESKKLSVLTRKLMLTSRRKP
ncbi:hypothetical protein HMPREF9565_02327 [Cutibacterium acnes HL053PA2]|nr:hypothetical protein HMPREF9575_02545 [Cutibacterium acnes HL110PA1]EFS43568.1 hypothetical protein HMPREF9576_01289 [Cutibacterium acnes HL110PA2]EFS50218.1 hypothetical protein HMPREF9587_02144 [Cutibacterium acnes HL025PA1]EFS71065.1 hypothetical protein HMPREF9617_01742 [Cutibacterium acnes HL056PA1]EFS76823.1 hypothetical protein HMPREF9591_01436 [Cutibacterium acnes HL086PA1]EFS96032.1 hypothetical protein HMPREF9608_00370 [Cutibacterium acnes HL067PA1]EFT06399.1 hypothetical protein